MVEYIIKSNWWPVCFDNACCKYASENNKPCQAFKMLLKTFPDLACKALDKHIVVDVEETHFYYPFEYIYYNNNG